MNYIEFKHLILNAKYHTKYEAIINLKNNEIFAYEALSKFEIDSNLISTEEIFRKLHHNNKLFFELEKRNKLLQIKNFPLKNKLFLNFDADIFVSDEQQDYWEKFLTSNKDNVVVEITENGSDDESSANIMRNFCHWLSSKKIDIALDDFGQDGSMFSFYMMNKSKYIKIDKSFLKQIRINKNYIHYLNGLLRTIKENGQKSIIEGVETKYDYELTRHLDCDFIQGYYFDSLQIVV